MAVYLSKLRTQVSLLRANRYPGMQCRPCISHVRHGTSQSASDGAGHGLPQTEQADITTASAEVDGYAELVCARELL